MKIEGTFYWDLGILRSSKLIPVFLPFSLCHNGNWIGRYYQLWPLCCCLNWNARAHISILRFPCEGVVCFCLVTTSFIALSLIGLKTCLVHRITLSYGIRDSNTVFATFKLAHKSILSTIQIMLFKTKEILRSRSFFHCFI